MNRELEAEVVHAVMTAEDCRRYGQDGVEHARNVIDEIVRRLLAGGISETAIRNTLVHYKEPGPIVACDGIDQPMTIDGEPVTAHQLMHHREPSS